MSHKDGSVSGEMGGLVPGGYAWDVFPIIERPTSDKNEHIPDRVLRPHYSNPRFFRGATLNAFLAEDSELTTTDYGTEEVAGAHYVHSDAFLGHERWTDETFQRAKDRAGYSNSAAFYEELLRDVLQDPALDLRHIITGVNSSNGFPYQVFGYVSAQ